MTATTPPQEKRREEYRHRHIDIDIRKKERRLYIPHNWEHRFLELQKILAREGNSISRWFREQADPYIDLHEPGNPQQRIDTIIRDGKPYHARSLCGCGQPATRKVTLQGGMKLFCCSLHMPRNVVSWKELKR